MTTTKPTTKKLATKSRKRVDSANKLKSTAFTAAFVVVPLLDADTSILQILHRSFGRW